MSVPDPGAPLAAHPEFLVEDVLGRGGSATVYRARETATGQVVAWKVWDAVLDVDARERFVAECTVHTALSEHPRIVRLLGRGLPSDGERPWITTVLHESSLERRLAERGLTLPQWRTLAEDLLSGLAAVHTSGHVHRDVKPANVLVQDGRWALGDLGLVHSTNLSAGDAAAGTAAFIAPELGRVGAVPTPSSDVFAAATTLLVALDHLSGPGAVPLGLEGLLTRASSVHPSDRPVDAGKFLERLQDALPTVTPTRTGRSPRSLPRVATVGALAVGLGLTALGIGQSSPALRTAAPATSGAVRSGCEQLPQPDLLTIPDGPVLSRVAVDGYVTGGHISIEVAGRIAPGTTGGTLWFLAVPSTESLGRDGRPGSGRWYPLGEVSPDADGCFLTVPLTLSSYDAAQGIEYRVHLAALTPERDAQARLLLAENSSEGIVNTSQAAPPGVVVVDSFDLPTAGFDRL